MKKIILLLCIAAVALIPLSVNAEMTVMSDSEMQMVSGQISVAGLVGTGDGIFRCTALKLGISPALIYTVATTGATPLINNDLMVAAQPIFATLVNFQIPQDLINAISKIN